MGRRLPTLPPHSQEGDKLKRKSVQDYEWVAYFMAGAFAVFVIMTALILIGTVGIPDNTYQDNCRIVTELVRENGVRTPRTAPVCDWVTPTPYIQGGK